MLATVQSSDRWVQVTAKYAFRKVVAWNIRRLCSAQGYSLGSVAAAAGLSESAFFRSLGGQSSMRLDTLERICGSLGCSPAELFEPPPPVPDPRLHGQKRPLGARSDRLK